MVAKTKVGINREAQQKVHIEHDDHHHESTEKALHIANVIALASNLPVTNYNTSLMYGVFSRTHGSECGNNYTRKRKHSPPFSSIYIANNLNSCILILRRGQH